MVIRGDGGALEVGTRCAGQIGAWTLTRASDRPEFEAACELKGIDTFWWEASPMMLTLCMGERQWRWPVSHLPAPNGLVKLNLEGTPIIR